MFASLRALMIIKQRRLGRTRDYALSIIYSPWSYFDLGANIIRVRNAASALFYPDPRILYSWQYVRICPRTHEFQLQRHLASDYYYCRSNYSAKVHSEI